jgi:hypothetical protein
MIVGIINTRKTFLLAYCYITSKSAKSFDFVAGELTKYVTARTECYSTKVKGAL